MHDSFRDETRSFRAWIASGFSAPAVSDRVRDYLLHFTSDAPAGGKYQTLWPHQREAVLRSIYTKEVLEPHDIGWKNILLNIVTGGGKTAIIAALMAYLRVC